MQDPELRSGVATLDEPRSFCPLHGSEPRKRSSEALNHEPGNSWNFT